MSNELLRTGAFVAAALALAVGAALVQPEAAAPEVLQDEGEVLFPEFRNVMDVKAIEVIAYDEDQAAALPLKVEFRKGRWVMPSHNDYPAEAGDRLEKTAGALLDLKKDVVLSDRMEDHAAFGVIDPLDTKVATLTGRGKRVTLRNEQGDVLADAILGKPVPEREGFRCVRLPGQKRVYGVKTAADPSANFGDWVEGNLLQLAGGQVRRVTVNSYSIDETFGRLMNVQRVTAVRDGGSWKVDGSRRVSASAIQAVVAAVSGIRIVGARPKPRPLAEQLRSGQLEMTLEAVMSLRQTGFFLTPTGQLLANEGEVTLETERGLIYTLRFGEIASRAAGSATAAEAPAGEGGSGETAKAQTNELDRYLFVTVRHDPLVQAKHGGAGGGERNARALNAKFADWYYVISGRDFAKIRAK